MSNITGGAGGGGGGGGGSFSSGNTGGSEGVVQYQSEQVLKHFQNSNSLSDSTITNSNGSTSSQHQPPPAKKKRSLPGNPDPSAEVIVLSPKSLMATNRFVCEICNKGFQRDQNLQLHRRGHNLPWKLKQRTGTEIRKRVYVCPETSCVHHNPSRALGDLTGIKKHFSRKHGEKKWKCDKCSKIYAVQSDWKAHSKICGTREYKCDCGTIFSRRDSFITHRAFCDALTEENNKAAYQGQMPKIGQQVSDLNSSIPMSTNANPPIVVASEFNHYDSKTPLSLPQELMPMPAKPLTNVAAGTLFTRNLSSSNTYNPSSPSLQLNSNSSTIFEGNGHPLAGSTLVSATALLQKAAQMGPTVSGNSGIENGFVTSMAPPSFGAMQQDISSQYFGANMGFFNDLVDQSNALSKVDVDQDSRSTSTNGFMYGPGNSNGDVMTLDFLGVGGRSRHENFHDQQQKKQQEMGLIGGMGQPRSIIQGLNHFQQQAAHFPYI
ncbi:protein indeterminate-domain 2-like [Quillaja saponaria]|uniref:Protein indeterminate-domain 2-like n=1 Tax=Quillaja saponaria TaxID=32244 RepID=A0AAD7Q1W9_QUISA|nr:protein indeterminate-domain 2-like [Quillaja saponaria]